MKLRRFSREVQQAQVENMNNLPFVATGPPNARGDDEDRLLRLVDQWYRGSVQLESICAASGTTYVHVLQPNQYVPDSKPMSPEENFSSEGGYSRLVVAGYPLLRECEGRFAEQGIQFVDASMVFRDVPETLYCDACCHLNRRGNQLLAEFIAGEVAARIEN